MQKFLFLIILIMFAFASINADNENTGAYDKFADMLLKIEIPNNEYSAEGEKLEPFAQTAFLISKTGVCVSYVGERMPESILNILAIYKGKEVPILPLLAQDGFVIFKLRFIDSTDFFTLAEHDPKQGETVIHLGKTDSVTHKAGKVLIDKKTGEHEFYTNSKVEIEQGGPVINSAGNLIGVTRVGEATKNRGEFIPKSEILKVLERRFSNVSVEGTLAEGELIKISGELIDFGLDDYKDSFVEVIVDEKTLQTSHFKLNDGKLSTEVRLTGPEKADSPSSDGIPTIVKLKNGKQIAGLCKAENLYFEASGNEIELATKEINKIIVDHVGELVTPQDTVETKSDGELMLKFLFNKFKILVGKEEKTFARKDVEEIIFGKTEIPYRLRLVWTDTKNVKHSFSIEEFLADTTKKKYQWELPTPEIKPKGPNLVQNPGFQELDDDKFVKNWQKQDGVTSMIEKSKNDWGGKDNFVLHLKSDVLETEYFKRLEQMSENPIPPPFVPTKVTEKMKFKTIGASYGVSFYSDEIKIKKGITYLLEIDEKGAMAGTMFHAKIFVKGYKRLIYKGKERDRVLYKMYMPCRNASGTWEHFSQVFSPTYRTPDVDFIKVMIFAYWPIGDYYFDNVSIREVGDHNIYNKHIHDDKKIPMKSDK